MFKKSLIGLSLMGLLVLSGCQLRDVKEHTQTSNEMVSTEDSGNTIIKHGELEPIKGLEQDSVTSDTNKEMIKAIVNHTLLEENTPDSLKKGLPDKIVVQMYDPSIEESLSKELKQDHPEKEFIVYSLREGSEAKVNINDNFLIIIGQPNQVFKGLGAYVSKVTVNGKEEYLDNTIYYQTKMNYQSYEAVGNYEFTKGNSKEIISYGISSTIKD